LPAPTAVAGSPLRGIVMMLLSVFLFSCMDATVKSATADYPVGQIIFFRNLVAFLPIAVFVHRAGGFRVLRTRQLGAHLQRSVVGVIAMATGFLGYFYLPLGDAVSLEQSGPIFLTALSVPLLGEKVGWRRWAAVGVGFVGVLVMTRPGAGLFNPAALLSLTAALCYALAMIAIRRLGRNDGPATTVFYFTLCAVTAGAASLPFAWVTPDARGLALLVAIGLFGGFAQMAMTEAFRIAPVALIAPFNYASLVFAMAFGYAFWGEVPDAFLLAGAAIVVASGLYILHRETTLVRRRRAAAAAAAPGGARAGAAAGP
jgi:drug/metabolite transporter (DMT)-like permease